MREEEILEADAVEEPAGPEPAEEQSPTDELTVREHPTGIEGWKGEARTVAIAAAGGLAAGAATVAAMTAVKRGAVSRRPARRPLARRDRQSVVASRSFIVDVHLLGR